MNFRLPLMDDLYILVDKKPVIIEDYLEYSKWRSDPKNRRLAYTYVEDLDNGNVEISTVFLSTPHGFSKAGDPYLFETMVFGGFLNEECNRYTTWDEAIAGHEEMVRRVKERI